MLINQALFAISLLSPTANAIQYFVQLKAPSTFEALLNSDDTVNAVHHLRPLVRKAISFGSFEGFTGDFGSDVLSRLRKNPLVQEVTLDITVKTCDDDEVDDEDPEVDNANDDDVDYITQESAPRHLARLTTRHRLPPTDNHDLEYYYPLDNQASDVDAYVIDTGIACEHPEFEGRCQHGADFTGEGNGDNNGHGTHVAGIIGSKTYGVAKKINIIEVKALDRSGTGSLSSIISGIEYAVKQQRQKIQAKGESNTKGLINLSIGAFRNSVLNQAVEEAYKAGLVLVAAAGNSNMDACATSPASAKHAITVGAIDDRTDALAGFSNWGRCVNILASGVRVASVNRKSQEYPLLLSGTSMSTPSVAGVAGLLLGAGVSPQDIKQHLKDTSTIGAVPRLSLLLRPVTPNRLVYLDYTETNEDYDVDAWQSHKNTTENIHDQPNTTELAPLQSD